MEQLKKQLELIKKYSFWIMCVVVLGLSVTCWYMATSKLNAERIKNVADITTQTSSLKSVESQRPHPNDSTIKGMIEVTSLLTDDVVKGWEELAANQESVLVWPANFDQRFQDAVKGMRPIELSVAMSDRGEKLSGGLPNADRKYYQTFIIFELEKNLAQTIGAIWKASAASIPKGGGGASGAIGGMPSGGGLSSMPSSDMPLSGGLGGNTTGRPNPEDRATVLWKGENQQEIINTHFSFIADTDAPTTLQVLYAQEDLWVLQNVLNIIKTANGDANARHEAAIKTIDSISIGRSALGLNGRITSLGGDSAGGPGGNLLGAGGGTGGAMPGMPGAGGAGGAAGGAVAGGAVGGAPAGGVVGGGGGLGLPGAGAKTAVNDLADGRYVDRNYQPLTAARLRPAMEGKATNKDDVLLAVAKRVPVRLHLVIDQSRLNVILAACANARLPIEVRQVRIGKTDVTASAGGMGGGGMGGLPSGGGAGGMSMPSLPSGGGGMLSSPDSGSGGLLGGGGFSGSGGGGGSSRNASVSSSQTDPSEVKVEIYGIVYLYNPVNRKLLKLDAPASAVPGAAAPATANGVTPPVAGTNTTQAPAASAVN